MNHKGRTPRKYALAVGFIVLLGLTVRATYLWEASHYPNFATPYAGLDAALYQDLAERIAQGDLLLGDDVYHYRPLFPYVLGGLQALFGGSPWVGRLANVMLGSGTILLITFSTLLLFQSRAVSLLAGLGAALFGPFLVFDTSALKESLGTFLTAGSLLLLIVCTQKRRAFGAWLSLGVALGLAYNLTGQLGLFLIVLMSWFVLRGSAGGAADEQDGIGVPAGRIKGLSALVVGMFLAVLPFALRNYYVTRDLVLIAGHSGIHVYIGNHRGASGRYSPVPGMRPNAAGHLHDARRLAEEDRGRPLSSSQVSGYWWRKALSFMRAEPGTAAGLLGRKTRLLLSAYEIPNNENYQYLTARSPYLALFPGMGIVLPLGLSGLILSLNRYRQLAPLILYFTSYALAVVLSFVTWRYRLPLALALIPWAGFFVVRTGAWIRQGRLSSVAVSIVLLAGFWYVTQGTTVREQYHERDMRKAEVKMRMSRQEEAIRQQIHFYRSTQQRDVSLLWLTLAELRRRQYDREGAVKILREALLENGDEPRLRDALENMRLPRSSRRSGQGDRYDCHRS